MKKRIGSSKLTMVMIFVCALCITLGAGAYGKSLNERVRFSAEIPTHHMEPIILDLANQGIPKKIAQPRLLSIATGYGGGITNSSEEPLHVQVKLNGFPDNVKMKVGAPFDYNTGELLQVLNSGESFGIGLDVIIPRESLKKTIGLDGNIILINSVDQTLLGNIPVYIVNSNYGDPYEELQIDKPNEHSSHKSGGH